MSNHTLWQYLAFVKNLQTQSLLEIKKGRESLTRRYTAQGAGFLDQNERIAYILARAPATYETNRAVLAHLPLSDIGSVLDLGAGPGTASLASLDMGIGKHYTLIDNDGPMCDLSRAFFAQLGISSTVSNANLLNGEPLPTRDLVILSYVLGEMSEIQQLSLLERAWNATNKFLVIVNPGTSRLFSSYLKWRDFFINYGGTILAPCPSHDKCPMSHGDWCHFKARVQRTKELKYVKDGTMSFEDEPYNYLIIAKQPVKQLSSVRILENPQHRPGHFHVKVCKGDVIATYTISQSDPRYKILKKLKQGDVFPSI